VATPTAYYKNGIFHLYYDIVYDPKGFKQVAISYANSQDGRHFTEKEPNIIVYKTADWNDREVLAPTVIEDDGVLKMWYAGHTTKRPPKGQGIGYATKEIK
jgi:hypothetical protein